MIQIEIGVNAGAISRLLADKGMLSIRELGESTSFSALNMGMALGWLAREGKLNFIEKDRVLYVELLNTPSDIYY